MTRAVFSSLGEWGEIFSSCDMGRASPADLLVHIRIHGIFSS